MSQQIPDLKQYLFGVGVPTPLVIWVHPEYRHCENDEIFDEKLKHVKTERCGWIPNNDYSYSCLCGWPKNTEPEAA